jgi:LPS export ABC transporter protein LptC
MKVRLYDFVRFFEKKQRCKNLGIVVLSLGATILILSCSIEATDLQTFYTDSGIVRYFLTTPKLLSFDQEKEPYKEFPEGFHIQEFDENKKIISELSANYGKNFVKEKKWLATGKVVMVNDKGDTLRTEELIYLTQENRIFSDKFVNIKKGDMDFNGTGGFESDTQMKKWSFKKTKGHIFVEEK